MSLKTQELTELRSELHFLKGCQLKYFLLSIGATGAVAGFGEKLNQDYGEVVFLAPLLVVLPCWWIFFDKATTITRIVGYYRLLESFSIMESTGPLYYIGWENSLALCRELQRSKKLGGKTRAYARGAFEGLCVLIPLRTTQRYWVISWLTFFSLCLTSILLGAPAVTKSFDRLWFSLAIFVALSVIHNLSVLGRLIAGEYSYVKNYLLWKRVLASPEAKGS